MDVQLPAWYCARTKPKHEHIVAANLRKNLVLEVFHPRLRLEKPTQRGLVRVVESLFPCYLFVRCVLAERHDEIQYSSGFTRWVNFGNQIPVVPDATIAELRQYFEEQEVLPVEDRLQTGDEVTVAAGAFAGMTAQVLRNLPARGRVQVLLEILGRTTQVEVDRGAVVLVNNSLADRAPVLAAAPPN